MNKKEIIELFGYDDFNFNHSNIEICIWHKKFSDYVNYYNENLCNLINFNINFEGIKKSDVICQNNLLLLNSLKSDVILNISTCYGFGEIILDNLKNIKCEINLTCIDIILNDYNHKYSNITLYPMIDNNYYTDEKIKLYCLLNNIKVFNC
jgi:hypothetical protein